MQEVKKGKNGMYGSKCPMCGAKHFYVKSPEDQYETYDFHMESGKDVFDSSEDDPSRPDAVLENDVVYCGVCAWNGVLKDLK